MPADKKEEKPSFGTADAIRIIKYIIGGFVVLTLVFGSFFVVGPGEKGVIFNSFIGIKDKTYDEGLHFKLPFFETQYRFEVRTRIFRDEASAASKDLQVVSTEVALNYHLNK